MQSNLSVIHLLLLLCYCDARELYLDLSKSLKKSICWELGIVPAHLSDDFYMVNKKCQIKICFMLKFPKKKKENKFAIKMALDRKGNILTSFTRDSWSLIVPNMGPDRLRFWKVDKKNFTEKLFQSAKTIKKN